MSTKKIFLVALTVFLAGYLFGCGPKEQIVGQPISETTITPIKNILLHPENFAAKAVRIEGKITDECPAGGWFMLKDQTGIVYVDLHASQLAIPQAVGHKAIVQGLVRREGPQVEIVGKGVQIQ